MGLFSLFQRKSDKPAGPGASRGAHQADAPDIEAARTRARRRLIGAAVLVLVAVIGFPLVFETQPRPASNAASIEVARNDATAAGKQPPSRAVTGVVTPAPTPTAPRNNEVITETAGEAGREVPLPASAATTSPARPAAKEPAPKESAAKEPAVKEAAAKPTAAAASRPAPAASRAGATESGRAQALLEGKTESAKADAPAAAESGGRFVVQVGAFADVNAARDVRQRVEKLGLKTYTQVIDTPGGKRIRVRVGPFGAKDEADRVVARIKSAGLSPAVLTL